MKHCMLLWKKPSAKPLQTQIDCAFDVFSVIRDLREEYSPPTIKLRLKARQPAASFPISKPKLLEWERKWSDIAHLGPTRP